MKTPQEIFDQVSKHLLKQNEKASIGGLCKYRAASGLSCAVGCLIPDELYDARIEGASIQYLVQSRSALNKHTKSAIFSDVLEKSGINLAGKDVTDILVGLQRIHDYTGPESWASELKEVAQKFQLTYNA